MSVGKRFKATLEKVDSEKLYALDDALSLLKETANAKFDETVEIAFNLGVDPKHADQMVRGAIVLPKGTGKTVKIAVFAKAEKAEEAKKAGADIVGDDDLVEQVKGGKIDFDSCIATPDMMSKVGTLGRVLGPRGIMPNPKLGTVTMDIAKAVKDAKGGKVEFRVEKNGILQAGLGKVSFSQADIKDNVVSFIRAINQAKPSGSKGIYIKKITVASTMGPGIKLDVNELLAEIA